MKKQTILKTWLVISGFTVSFIVTVPCVEGATLFSDNFDIDSSLGWNINATADNSAIFAFDYSSIGVPSSPNGGGSTAGLRLASNLRTGSSQAITLSPVGKYFTGTYQLAFDMWMNFSVAGLATTEFLTAGIGYDDTTINGISGSGGWFAVDGDGGSARDYRAFHNDSLQLVDSGQYIPVSNNNTDPYFSGFGGINVATAVPAQGQIGTTTIGSAGFAWHEVTITVNGVTALWAIDGLPIAELNPASGPGFALDGNISIGYMDIFTSVAEDPDLSFGLIDNLVVTDVPEPATLALLGLGGLLLRKRQ